MYSSVACVANTRIVLDLEKRIRLVTQLGAGIDNCFLNMPLTDLYASNPPPLHECHSASRRPPRATGPVSNRRRTSGQGVHLARPGIDYKPQRSP